MRETMKLYMFLNKDCEECKRASEIFKKLEKEYELTIERHWAPEEVRLFSNWNVTGFPMFIFTFNGVELLRVSGHQTETSMIAHLERLKCPRL